jgi:hypothetical protein
MHTHTQQQRRMRQQGTLNGYEDSMSLVLLQLGLAQVKREPPV